MKIDASTSIILNNFSGINPSIILKPGRLRTVSSTKTVMAQAIEEQNFPIECAIYDLSKLLSTVSLFKEPELEFKEKHVLISEGKNKFKFFYTEPSLVSAPDSRNIKLPNPEVNFELKHDDLAKVLKALRVAGLPEIAVSGRDGFCFLEAIDSKGTTQDAFSVEVGETANTFKMIFRAENIRLIDGDYQVSISSKGLSHFKGTLAEYWIAVESGSTFA